MQHCVGDQATYSQGWTPLHVAAGHSSAQANAIIGDLANSGADLEATDREGRTPLLFALEGSRKDAVDALLRAGALSGLCSVDRRLLQQPHLLIVLPGLFWRP